MENSDTFEIKPETYKNTKKDIKGRVVSFGLQYTGICEICKQKKTIRQIVVENEFGEKIENICAECISKNYV